MAKKAVLAAIVVMVLALSGSMVWAHEYDGRRGDRDYDRYDKRMSRGMMGGYEGKMGGGMMGGSRMGQTNMDDPRFKIFQSTKKERILIQQKQLQLRALWLAEELDEAAIMAKRAEISDLKAKISEKMTSGMIELRKNNPDWRPEGMGGRQRGRGMGMGGGPDGCQD